MLKQLKQEKPWAVLKITRRQYEEARLWKRTPLDRKAFDALIVSLPEGFVDHLRLEADADSLVDAIFKNL